MLRNLMAAWSIPDVRRRLLFVVMMFAVFSVGLHIPVPGVDHEAMEQFVAANGVLQLLDTFSGGAFRKFAIFALGIMPYINASIIMQLLVPSIPALEQMQKEGEGGRKRIAQITRYMTAVLSVVQAVGVIVMLSNAAPTGTPIFVGGTLTKIQVVITLCAGTTFLMWLGELITERGIGQGVSLLIFAGIMARLPYDIALTIKAFSWNQTGGVGPLNIAALLLLFLATVVGIVYVNGGNRRIPIEHAKRMVGNRMVQQQSSFLPFKVNSAGVIPIIFAISIVMFPATIASYIRNPMDPTAWQSQIAGWVITFLSPGGAPTITLPFVGWIVPFPLGSMMYAALIFAFTYFYAAIQMNIPELADNLKKQGSYIRGVRPGRPTQEYLDRVVTRITFAGAAFLTIVGLLQYYTRQITGVMTFSLVGGTSLLIVVGVALDTMQNLESHLVMRNYEGFIRQQSRRTSRRAVSGAQLR